MRPDPLYARYPFLRDAREAVQRADIAPPRLVTEGDPAVERARERVERALMSGTVASETPGRWSDRDELLSYPIARILVSLVDVRTAVEKYAEAEAATAFERLTEDLTAEGAELQSVTTSRADLETFLAAFDLGEAVARVEGGRDRYLVDVAAYLRLADPDWGADWRLVNRELADGTVPIDGDELRRLLREAVRRRVAEGLPFDVRGSSGGDAIADALDEDVTALRGRLAERERLPNVETVVPAQFPPCMRALLAADDDDGADDPLPAHAAFAATAFLVSLGLDADDIADRWPVLDDGSLSYRATVLEDGDGSQYPAPSCATMQTFGDCVNPDDRCETIDHPLRYYASAVAEADTDASAD